MVRGGDRVAPRVRAAASACLVASGLLLSGVGGAIALADPGHGRKDDRDSSDGRKGSDSRQVDDSVGDIVRRAFGFDDGGDSGGQNTADPWQRPDTRWGNGRPREPGEGEPTKTDTPTRTETPTSKPCPPTETSGPTKPSEPPGEPGP